MKKSKFIAIFLLLVFFVPLLCSCKANGSTLDKIALQAAKDSLKEYQRKDWEKDGSFVKIEEQRNDGKTAVYLVTAYVKQLYAFAEFRRLVVIELQPTWYNKTQVKPKYTEEDIKEIKVYYIGGET